jgi:Ger(x)C family germination protein
MQSSGGGKFEIKDEIITSTAQSVPEIDNDLSKTIAGEMDISKAFIIVVGEELAKTKGIVSLFEPITRSNKGYIASKMMIAKGKGFNILSIQKDSSPIAFSILKLFQYSEEKTQIPKETTFTIWNKITDNELDAFVPLIQKNDENRIEIIGSALFNGDKYTGYSISTEQSSLLLFMLDRFEKVHNMNIQPDNEKTKPFSIIIDRIKQQTDLKVNEEVDTGEVVFNIDVEVYARVYSYDGTISAKETKKLNHLASTFLTKKAKEVTDLLIKAESDALGIQKELSTHYPDFIKNKNWQDIYNKVQINPEFKVIIMSTSNLK